MRRLITVAAITAGLSGSAAFAADFQTIGTMGMGGAGVARDMGAYAPYWNPAGLAFTTKTFSSTIGAGVGLRVSDGLADNVDKFSKFDNLASLTSTSSSNPTVLGDAVTLINVIQDIDRQKGTLSLNADAAVGVQAGHFGFGVFALNEGYGKVATVDTSNILPASNSTTSITPANLPSLAGTGNPTQTFFSPAEQATLSASLTTLGVPLASQTEIINAFGNSVATSGLSPQQALNTFTTVLQPALAASSVSSSAQNFNNNNTAVMVKNIAYAEVPLSYGHALDFGTSGRLGLGASLKPIVARVYQSRIKLVENGQTVTSKDIVDGFKDNFEESANITVDLGVQYKYASWLTLGVVGKNLTSPTFKSPALKDQKGRMVLPDGTLTLTPYKEADVKLKPQARFGVELAPLNWLTLAADLDLTENESVLSGLDFKNRQLGGGVELSPLSWFKLRAGMYKNLADSSLGNVATAGLTFGIPWVLLEVDGAYGLKTAKYKGEDYPRESRVQVQFVMQF